eukprot:s1981_g19.t1
MLCEYLFCRFDEPCGATIPNFICKAIAWFEKVAGFSEAEMIATSRVVVQVRDYITEKLATDAPPIRRASRYPAVAIESLEATVLDNELSVGMRIMAWVKLLKIWGALRYDDLQKINPAQLHLTGGRLTTTLRVTKTSGPGKRVQELPVCISEYAYAWDPAWIEQGFHLLKTHASFERDYLLPKLIDNWGGFQHRYATYQDVTSYSCHLRKRLLSYYDFSAIFPEDLASFWTEHSEHATLPTALAMLGVEGSKRDMVGRWKPDASDTYIRSYNGLVAQLQKKYGKAIRKPNRFRILDEIDIAESAEAWLRNRKTEIAEMERGDIVNSLMASMDSFAIQGDPGVPHDLPEEEEQLDVVEASAEDEHHEEQKTKRSSGFIVVTTARNCKRLHKAAGGCWMAREKIFKDSQEFDDKPEESQYTHVCRVCWPKTAEGEDSSGMISMLMQQLHLLIEHRNFFQKSVGHVEDRVMPAKEYLEKKLQELENGEFRAEPLSEVVSKDEIDPDVLMPIFDSKGSLTVKKGSTTVAMPSGPEQLRRRLSVMQNCLMMLALKHVNREEIQDVSKEVFDKYKDYILGDTGAYHLLI